MSPQVVGHGKNVGGYDVKTPTRNTHRVSTTSGDPDAVAGLWVLLENGTQLGDGASGGAHLCLAR